MLRGWANVKDSVAVMLGRLGLLEGLPLNAATIASKRRSLRFRHPDELADSTHGRLISVRDAYKTKFDIHMPRRRSRWGNYGQLHRRCVHSTACYGSPSERDRTRPSGYRSEYRRDCLDHCRKQNVPRQLCGRFEPFCLCPPLHAWVDWRTLRSFRYESLRPRWTSE